MENMDRLLSKGELSKVPDGEKWDLLCELLSSARKLCSLPDHAMRRVLPTTRSKAVSGQRTKGRKRRNHYREGRQPVPEGKARRLSDGAVPV